MDDVYTLIGLIVALITINVFMMRGWREKWKTDAIARDERMAVVEKRLEKHSEKHNAHDVNLATVKNDLKHIKENTDKIGSDVKELLKQSNGRRAASR